VIVDLQGRGNYLKKQFVARAIVDADALLSVAHFKGHPAGGYGGSLKNIGVAGEQARQDEPARRTGRRQTCDRRQTLPGKELRMVAGLRGLLPEGR